MEGSVRVHKESSADMDGYQVTNADAKPKPHGGMSQDFEISRLTLGKALPSADHFVFWCPTWAQLKPLARHVWGATGH